MPLFFQVEFIFTVIILQALCKCIHMNLLASASYPQKTYMGRNSCSWQPLDGLYAMISNYTKYSSNLVMLQGQWYVKL